LQSVAGKQSYCNRTAPKNSVPRRWKSRPIYRKLVFAWVITSNLLPGYFSKLQASWWIKKRTAHSPLSDHRHNWHRCLIFLPFARCNLNRCTCLLCVSGLELLGCSYAGIVYLSC